MYTAPTLTIETASGDSFTANKRGIINIVIRSDDVDDLPVTLQEVVYVLKLNVND